MPLPTFKTRDDIPEAVRDGYVERDGEWVPDVEDVSGLKANRDELLREAKELRKSVADLKKELQQKKSGLSDEEIAAQKAREEELTKPLQEQLAAERAELRKLKLDARVQTMLAEAGANPKRIDALYKLVGDRFDLSDNGTPVLKEKPTTPLDKYIADTVALEYPELFLAKGKPGDQFPGGAGGPAGREDLTKALTTNPLSLLQTANAKAAA